MEKHTQDKGGSYSGGWWDTRNQKRKERYHTDKKYQEKVKDWVRKSYHKDNPNILFCNQSTKEAVSRVTKFGSVRPVVLESGKEVKVHCLTATELAEALMLSGAYMVYRWGKKGMLPRPVYTYTEVEMRNRVIPVYTLYEAQAIVRCLRIHFCDRNFLYFRQDHDQTIELIARKVREARVKLEAV